MQVKQMLKGEGMNDINFLNEVKELLICGRDMLSTLDKHGIDVPAELITRYDKAIIKLEKE